jgi:protein gp37
LGNTKIEWCDKTYNPVTGCTKISPGCQNCYAERMSKRLAGRGGYPIDEPFKVTLHPDKLDEPLHWKKPSRIFVCSMSDLFHEDVPFNFIGKVFATMANAPQHTFLILTKRAGAMKDFFDAYYSAAWALPNVWLGVTAENQEQADKRIPILLQIPAAKRFVSVEPMLSAVNLSRYLKWPICKHWDADGNPRIFGKYRWEKQGLVAKGWVGLDHVICGGESGPGARPMHPDWVRSLKDQCVADGIPFMLKQWGEYVVPEDGTRSCRVCGCTEHNACDGGCSWVEPNLCSNCIGKATMPGGDRAVKYCRVGKKQAGRLLDGQLWDSVSGAINKGRG